MFVNDKHDKLGWNDTFLMCTVDADGSASGHLPQSYCPAATAVMFNMTAL